MRQWLAPFRTWQTLPLVAANILPLLGVAWLGWQAPTLLVLYWMETAIVGFWLVVRLCFAPRTQLAGIRMGASGTTASPTGIAIGLFVSVHAGIFMFVHFFFLSTLAPGEWSRHLSSPLAFLRDFVIPTGVWLPLAALFAVRGILTVADMASGRPVRDLLVGFYGRIIVMQLVIIAGGMIALFFGSEAMLLLLVVLKTIIEVYWDALAATAARALARRAG